MLTQATSKLVYTMLINSGTYLEYFIVWLVCIQYSNPLGATVFSTINCIINKNAEIRNFYGGGFFNAKSFYETFYLLWCEFVKSSKINRSKK